jgi:D-alanine-D-alanine ligase
MTLRLLLVFGGRSSEHEISLRRATELLAAVDRERFSPVLLGIGRDGSWRTGPAGRPLGEIVAAGSPVADLRALAPDIVFPLLHGPFGEDGTFQGLLEVLDLPYVGSGVLASALCMDKAVFKRLASSPGVELPIAPWTEVAASGAGAEETLARVEAVCGYPCFVKPANLGSSIGISRAADRDELRRALSVAARYDDKIVVERGIDAREIELAVLGDGGRDTLVTAPGEIRLPPGAWYDYDNKYENTVASLAIPAELPAATAEELQRIALAAFRLAGCTGLCRVDFLVERASLRPWLNELNTMPGFTTISMYPKLMQHAGIAYRDLVTRLCELGIAEHRRRARFGV